MPRHRREALLAGAFFVALGAAAAVMTGSRPQTGGVPTWLIIVGVAVLLAVLVLASNWKTPKKRGGRMKPDGGCGGGGD
jgi:membrane protein implicated in regulation of membrane protease activity